MKNIIKCLCVMLLFFSCDKPKPVKEKIVGIWKSQDGSIIEINNNNSVKIINYPLNLSNSNFKGELNGKGTWEIYKGSDVNWWVLEISILSEKAVPELYNNKIAIELFITQDGLLGNGEDITSLFIWKGDPDSDNRYEFKKK